MKPKINIAVLASYKIYPSVSGGQKGIALFYKYFSALMPVTLLSVPENAACRREADPSVAPLLPKSRLRYINPLLFFRLKKFIGENEITHLIIEHPYYGWLGRMLKKSCGITLVVHSHNIEALRFKSTGRAWWRLLYGYEKWTHHGADINFFITAEDMQYAIRNFDLFAGCCFVITYGTEIAHVPSAEEKSAARNLICEKHGIEEDCNLVLFNGFFDYPPNLAALKMILDKINPGLQVAKDFNYRLIICGKNLPASFSDLQAYADKNIVYAGFVADIRPYFIGCDIFINPINDGGGIKTKLVEALSYNLSAVSTASGAIGIAADATGGKLQITGNEDVDEFVSTVISADVNAVTGESFFNHFYWGNIAAKAAAILTGEIPRSE